MRSKSGARRMQGEKKGQRRDVMLRECLPSLAVLATRTCPFCLKHQMEEQSARRMPSASPKSAATKK